MKGDKNLYARTHGAILNKKGRWNVDNNVLYEELQKSHAQNKLTDTAAILFKILVENIASMKTYKNPDDADECISAGIEELIIKWRKFDMEKKNPFSYFTTVATFAITNTWNKLHGGKYHTISIDNFTNRF